MRERLKFGNIIFFTPILFAGSLFLKIKSYLRNAVTLQEVHIIMHTRTRIITHIHTTPIITRIHTLITTVTTIRITVIGGENWLTSFVPTGLDPGGAEKQM